MTKNNKAEKKHKSPILEMTEVIESVPRDISKTEKKCKQFYADKFYMDKF